MQLRYESIYLFVPQCCEMPRNVGGCFYILHGDADSTKLAPTHIYIYLYIYKHKYDACTHHGVIEVTECKTWTRRKSKKTGQLGSPVNTWVPARQSLTAVLHMHSLRGTAVCGEQACACFTKNAQVCMQIGAQRLNSQALQPGKLTWKWNNRPFEDVSFPIDKRREWHFLRPADWIYTNICVTCESLSSVKHTYLIQSNIPIWVNDNQTCLITI